MPRKIAMIGAGSVVFTKTLISDILATPALADSELALMAPTETKLRRMEAFVKRMIRDNGLKATLSARDAKFGDGRARVNGPELRDADGYLIG